VHVHPRYAIVMSILQARLVPMCNEGSQLVRRPLPVYRHNKIVQTDAEGMEVAELMGDGNAVLLLGHGICTSGASMAQSFSNAYNLEEQARMNWYAYCAAGPEHPGIPEDLLSERGATRNELPHFRDRVAEVSAAQAARGGGGEGGGLWMYYYDLIERRMKAEG
jgi:ribulose-5-phosphate 4-epimerase/fuculose-1-phosphate aldolase